jgi:hypothetical protein
MALYKWRHFKQRLALRKDWWNRLRHLHYQDGEDASAISQIPTLALIQPDIVDVSKWKRAELAALRGREASRG